MAGKRGQPKSDNPRNIRKTIRFTKSEYAQLEEYMQTHNRTITQTIFDGIQALQEKCRNE